LLKQLDVRHQRFSTTINLEAGILDAGNNSEFDQSDVARTEELKIFIDGESKAEKIAEVRGPQNSDHTREERGVEFPQLLVKDNARLPQKDSDTINLEPGLSEVGSTCSLMLDQAGVADTEEVKRCVDDESKVEKVAEVRGPQDSDHTREERSIEFPQLLAKDNVRFPQRDSDTINLEPGLSEAGSTCNMMLDQSGVADTKVKRCIDSESKEDQIAGVCGSSSLNHTGDESAVAFPQLGRNNVDLAQRDYNSSHSARPFSSEPGCNSGRTASLCIKPGPVDQPQSGGISGLANVPDYPVKLSSYCHSCYITREEENSTSRHLMYFDFNAASVDQTNLEALALKIYKSMRMICYHRFIRGVLKSGLMYRTKDFIKKLWRDECDISIPKFIAVYKIREQRVHWCEDCGLVFQDKHAVQAHFVYHSEASSDRRVELTCTICTLSFPSHLQLLKHRMLFHHYSLLLPFADSALTVKYPCSHCGRVLSSDFNLQRHIEKVHGDISSPALCTTCGELFKTKHLAKNHEAFHQRVSKLRESVERNFDCTYCTKKFQNRDQINLHLKSHYKEESVRLFCCQVCNQSFKMKHHLKNHMKIHSDVREYACPECGQEFRMKQHMESHLRLHTGNLFECQSCHRKFSSKAHLRVHMRDLHPQKAEFYPCKFCEEEFSKLKFLNKHIEVEHMPYSKTADSEMVKKISKSVDGKLFRCDDCDGKFTKKHYLKQHMSEHLDVDDKDKTKKLKMPETDKAIGKKKHVRRKAPKSNMAAIDNDGKSKKAALEKSEKCKKLQAPKKDRRSKAPLDTEQCQKHKISKESPSKRKELLEEDSSPSRLVKKRKVPERGGLRKRLKEEDKLGIV
jgi:hypothetical protein